MIAAFVRYLVTFAVQFGQGWNRFWFTPSDSFTLGAIRVLAGLVALYVCLTYSADLVRFFGPHGLAAQDTLEDGDLTAVNIVTDLSYSEPMGSIQVTHAKYLLPINYLFHFRNNPTGLWVVHILGIIVLAIFTAGFYSRLTSIAALVVILTYIHRAPMLTSEVEPILSLVLFYLCLGPCGASFSVDRLLAARRQTDAPKPVENSADNKLSTAATISTRLMQVHLTAAYAMMGLSKLAAPGADASVWWDGTGVWWLIAKPESRLVDFTALLHSHPYILDAWTQSIVFFELGFALLVWYRLFRPAVLMLAVLMWGSLALVTGLVAFCLVMLVANMAFVSPDALRMILTRGSREAEHSLARAEAIAG